MWELLHHMTGIRPFFLDISNLDNMKSAFGSNDIANRLPTRQEPFLLIYRF